MNAQRTAIMEDCGVGGIVSNRESLVCKEVAHTQSLRSPIANTRHCAQLRYAPHALQSVPLIPLMAAEARHVAGPCLVPLPHAYSPAHTHAHRSSRHMRPRIRIAMLSACTAMSCVHPLSCTDVRPRCADPPSQCCPQWHTRHLTLQVCSCESVHACMHDAKIM